MIEFLTQCVRLAGQPGVVQDVPDGRVLLHPDVHGLERAADRPVPPADAHHTGVQIGGGEPIRRRRSLGEERVRAGE